MTKPLAPYVPPVGDDEPLDAIEQALVRALVQAIVAELRQDARDAAPELDADDLSARQAARQTS